jgi:DnaK suppressor protein
MANGKTPADENKTSAESNKTSDSVPHGLFSKADLEMFRGLLMAEKAKLLEKAEQIVNSGTINMDKDEMYDEVDLASATVEQNLTFKLLDRDRKLLNEIEHALVKIDTGDYGYCEGTGEPIPRRRLEVRPWTRHSVKYKEQLERRKKSGRGVGDDDDELMSF